MRSILPLFLLLACLAAAPALAQDRIRLETFSYAFDPDGVVSVENYKGSITVEGWDRPEIHIEARVEAEDVDGIIMLPDVRIVVGGSTTALDVETDYRTALYRVRKLFRGAGMQRLPLVHYTIRMPRTARLKVDDYMSAIQVVDLLSAVELFTYKGDVTLARVGGSLKLETVQGDAYVAFDRLTRDSSIDTYEGDVDIQLPRGTGFLLDLRLGDDRRARFAADSTFAALVHIGKVYHGRVNGGGPRLGLATTSGTFRLSSSLEALVR